MANRLEKAIEIINLRNRYYEELDETEAINYIIEQAKRVPELEEENKELESLAKMQHDAKIEIEKRCLELEEKLKDQIDSNWKLDKINRMWLRDNKRYREALEEIARGRFPGASYKARKALEGTE